MYCLDQVFKKSFASLEEYLECFRYTTGVMQSAENLERVAYEFACDNYAENVFYFEVSSTQCRSQSALVGNYV